MLTNLRKLQQYCATRRGSEADRRRKNARPVFGLKPLPACVLKGTQNSRKILSLSFKNHGQEPLIPKAAIAGVGYVECEVPASILRTAVGKYRVYVWFPVEVGTVETTITLSFTNTDYTVEFPLVIITTID